MILTFLTACSFLMKKWDLSCCGAAGFLIYTVSTRHTCLCKNFSFFVHMSYGLEAIHLKVNILLWLANG